jgi:hypothetical protein
MAQRASLAAGLSTKSNSQFRHRFRYPDPDFRGFFFKYHLKIFHVIYFLNTPRLTPAITSHIQHPHKHSQLSHSTLRVYATVSALQSISRVAENCDETTPCILRYLDILYSPVSGYSDYTLVQGDQKVSVHLMITILLATWLNLTAWQPTAWASGTLDSH